MQQDTIAVYEGHQVKITNGCVNRYAGHQFKVAIISKKRIRPLSEPVSVWELIYDSKASADKIFLSAFGITADEAFKIDFAKNKKISFVCKKALQKSSP